MLSEVSLKEALKMYIDNNEKIYVLRFLKSNNRYCMYTIDELFEKAKFLIDIPQPNDHAQDNNFAKETSYQKYDEEYAEESIEDAIENVKHMMISSNKNEEKVDSNSSNISFDIDKTSPADDSNTIIKSRQKSIDLGKLYALRDAGWTYKAIAQEVKCSTSTARKYALDKKLEKKVKEASMK